MDRFEWSYDKFFDCHVAMKNCGKMVCLKLIILA